MICLNRLAITETRHAWRQPVLPRPTSYPYPLDCDGDLDPFHRPYNRSQAAGGLASRCAAYRRIALGSVTRLVPRTARHCLICQRTRPHFPGQDAEHRSP